MLSITAESGLSQFRDAYGASSKSKVRIHLDQKEVKFFYGVVIAVDLVFLFMNTPWMSLPIVEGQPAQLTSVFDFVKYQLDLKNEQNVATWYSSALLLAAGIMAAINCLHNAPSSRFRWIERVGWSAICLVLTGLSADETATVHETLARLFNAINEGTGREQYKVGAGDWVAILLPVIGIVAVGMAAFFLYLFRSHIPTLILAAGGILFWVAAIYGESIEAGTAHLKMSRVAEGFIEEGCEIIGATSLLFAFIEFFRYRQSANGSSSRGAAKIRQKQRRSR